MLDEYLALGGVELGNNQRAYTYSRCMPCCAGLLKCPGCSGIHDATNPWTDAVYDWVEIARNLATNPSFETTSGTVEVYRNLATNPSFEATSGTVEVRRNLFADPSAITGTSTWWPTGGATLSKQSGAAFGTTSATRWTATSATTNLGMGTKTAIAISTVYSIRFSIRASIPLTLALNYRPVGSGSATGEVFIQNLAVTTGVQEVVATFTTTSTPATSTGALALNTTSNVIGEWVEVTKVLVEQSPVVGTYFDGSGMTPADPDLTASWTGTANASASILSGAGVASAVGNKAAVISSTDWMRSGARSVRVIPNGSDSGSVAIITTPGLTVGQPYTAVATVRLTAAQTGTLSAFARGFYRNGVPFTYLPGYGVPSNVAGVYEIRATFTCDSATQTIELVNGAAPGGGDVWFDDFMVVAGTYTGPYFDGSNRPRLRENLATNPNLGTNATGWSGASGTAGRIDIVAQGYPPIPGLAFAYRRQATNPSTTFRTTYTLPALTVGATYTLGCWAYADLGTSPDSNYFDLRVSTSPSTSGSGTALLTSIPLLTWTWSEVTFTAAAETYYLRGQRRGSAGGGFETMMLTGVLLERTDTPGPYFDGASTPAPGFGYAWEGTANASASYLYDADLTPSWVGAANASASVMTAAGVADVALPAPTQGVIYQTGHGPAHGSKAVRELLVTTAAVPIVVANYDPPGGETWTLIGKVRPNARDQRFYPRIGATEGQSFEAPKGVWTEYRVTLVSGAGGTSQTGLIIKSLSGHQPGDTVDSDAVLIVEGDYGGDYFDGSNLPAGIDPNINRVRWLGAANASASALDNYQVTVPAESTGEPPYDCSALSFAPWYDATNEASQRLAGFYLLSVRGVTDSTMTASVTEGLDDGGVIGAQRNASRTIRVRTMIVGCGKDAAEYGLAWLKAALSESFCERHGSACGTADLDFFIDCPPSLDSGDPDYGASTTRYRRFLHGVGATSGPVISEEWATPSGAYVMIVDYILTAESPFVWGETLDIAGSGQTLTAYDDIPFNLMRYPSGEVGDGIPAVVATQYAFNGSVEFGATGWNHVETSIPAGITAGASTDIAAVGPNSYRVRLLATGTVTGGVIDLYYDVALGALPGGSKPSVSMWGAALTFAGAPSVGALSGSVEWRTASASLSTTPLGTIPTNGGNLLGKGLTIPATATIARLHLTASGVGAVSTNDLRVYADAFALTVP